MKFRQSNENTVRVKIERWIPTKNGRHLAFGPFEDDGVTREADIAQIFDSPTFNKDTAPEGTIVVVKPSRLNEPRRDALISEFIRFDQSEVYSEAEEQDSTPVKEVIEHNSITLDAAEKETTAAKAAISFSINTRYTVAARKLKITKNKLLGWILTDFVDKGLLDELVSL